MDRLKALTTFDWIAVIAFVGSLAFRLIGKFLGSDSGAYEAVCVASELLGAAAFLWMAVRVMQSITPPLYRKP
jgi:hypothetical protein